MGISGLINFELYKWQSDVSCNIGSFQGGLRI